MSDRQDLSPDPGAESASNVEKNDPHRGSLRLTRLRIRCVHDGVYPNTNLAGLYEISDSRIRDLLRLGEARQHGGEGDGEKEHFHLRLQGSGVAPASERGVIGRASCRRHLEKSLFAPVTNVTGWG